jgi:hypothetical protein
LCLILLLLPAPVSCIGGYYGYRLGYAAGHKSFTDRHIIRRGGQVCCIGDWSQPDSLRRV